MFIMYQCDFTIGPISMIYDMISLSMSFYFLNVVLATLIQLGHKSDLPPRYLSNPKLSS